MTASAAGARQAAWPAAVLFDLDGTLADSFAAIAAALDHVLVSHGFAARGEAWTRRHVGRGSAALVRDALGEGAAEATASGVGAAFYARYRDTFVAATPPLPGALAVVRGVHALTGGRVGVVSNKAAELCNLWLAHHRFAPWIAAVSGPDSSGVRKPGAGAVEPVLRALGVVAAEALLVGDMTVDVETGLGLGMPVAVVHGQTSTRLELESAGATAVLDDLRGLPAWLEAERRRRRSGAGRPVRLR